VPNKFPAIQNDGEPIDCCSKQRQSSSAPELFLRKQTRGGHEVIIEAPSHVQSITQLQTDHVALVFEAYQRRLRYWRSVHAMRYAVVFKNNGADAGASLVHAHSQLICTDFLPSDVLKTQRRSMEYLQTKGRCYACDILEKELQATERIVAQTASFVALCPFASRLPYSVSILPKRHQAAFEESSSSELAELARLVQQVLRAVETEHPNAAYNYVLQTAPLDSHDPAAFHWRLKILPRLIKVAGFEWSSDCYINTVLPEDAAEALGRHIQPAQGLHLLANSP
jgi:UDPglucose--hexose-1-phosphate uridylyltransferase